MKRIVLIAAFVWLSGCSGASKTPPTSGAPATNSRSQVAALTDYEGRWLTHVIEVIGSNVSVMDLQKTMFDNRPISLGRDPLPIETDKILALTLQVRRAGQLEPSLVISGPNRSESIARAEFTSAGLDSPLQINAGWGYVVGNWQFVRTRRVRATAIWFHPLTDHCETPTTGYDRNAHLLFVVVGDRNRVYAVQKNACITVDGGATYELLQGQYMEVVEASGEITVAPTYWKYDDEYVGHPRNVAYRVPWP